MSTRLDALQSALEQALGTRLTQLTRRLDEITIEVPAAELLSVTRTLRDAPGLKFAQLIDLCGMDYASYGEGAWDGLRFSVVYHLLSTEHNHRVRLRVFAPDDELPVLESVVEIWPAANWYEREAFDLYGLIFNGHPDLRRLLTDYGFVGHPFRKDFPLSGNVEMRYDPSQQRVIYQPVSIEPRENVPRVVREDHYAAVEPKK